VLVVKAQMPAQQQLPEALWGLSCRQAIELTDTNWDHDLERLAAAIESAPGGPSRRRRTSGRRPIPVPALAIIAVVVLGLVVQGVRVLMSGESGPSRMTGWFNIAVADFEVLDSGGKVVSSAVAAQLSTRFRRLLELDVNASTAAARYSSRASADWAGVPSNSAPPPPS